MIIRPLLAAPPLATATLLVGLGFAACRPAENPSTAGANATAVVAISRDIAGVNPLTSDNLGTREIHDQLFLRLFEELPDYHEHPPTLEPELVDTMAWSDDGRTLTLALKPEVRWSDGVSVTAADVAWTLTARVDPGIAWTHADTQERIEGWEVLGEREIAVRFRLVYPDRLANLNASPILPRHVWSQVPFDQWRQSDEWFRQHLVVSGPFELAEWRPDDRLVLKRNSSYFRPDRPRLDRVVFLVVPEKANQLEKLLAGEIDFVSALRPATAARVDRSSTARVDAFWHRQYAFIMWNGCRPPLDDPTLRLALTLAIDRPSIREAVYGDYARLAVSPVPSSLWAFNRDLEPWPYDPAAAARLLDSRGWRDRDGDGLRDRGGEPLKLRLSTNAENRMRIDMITLVQDQLADVGIGVELETFEFGTWLARTRGHDYDGSLGSWVTDTSLDLYYLFHHQSIAQGGNWVCYSNPEADRLIELARSRSEAADKLDPLLALQEILHADQPYTFLFELKRINGMSRRLRDARPNSLRIFANLEDWWIDSAA